MKQTPGNIQISLKEFYFNYIKAGELNLFMKP